MLAMAIPLSLIAAVVIVLATAYEDTTTAHNHADLKRLRYGFPVAWVTQDQTAYSPPRSYYPESVRFDNPMENPTTVSPTRFAGDIAALSATLLVAFAATAGVIHLVVRDGVGTPGRIETR
jgi:hypothetical protein